MKAMFDSTMHALHKIRDLRIIGIFLVLRTSSYSHVLLLCCQRTIVTRLLNNVTVIILTFETILIVPPNTTLASLLINMLLCVLGRLFTSTNYTKIEYQSVFLQCHLMNGIVIHAFHQSRCANYVEQNIFIVVII